MRFPVAIWEDAEGSFTGSVLDGAVAAAVDDSVAGVIGQLKKYLSWLQRSDGGLGSSDFQDLELHDHRIRVRPEYRTESSVFPVAVPFELRVTCVHGRRRDGTLHCVLPTLGVRFSHQADDPVEELLVESVQQALGKRTPQQLSRELMPPKIRIDAVHVRESDAPARLLQSRFPALESVAEPLGKRSRGSRFARAIQREDAVRLLADRLLNDTASLLLLGDSGIGKTTVLVEAIRQIARTNAGAKKEKAAKPRQFWLTTGQRLIAGMKYLGQWEERLEEVIRELHEIEGTLCVESLLDLVRIGGCEPTDSLAAFCIPYVQRGELRLLAEASPTELDACRRLLPGLVDLFQVATVAPLDRTATTRVLTRIADTQTRSANEVSSSAQSPSHTPRTSDLAAERTVQLFHRFEPYRALPGDAVPFWRDVLERAAREKLPEVTSPFVVAQFARRTGISNLFLQDDLPLPREDVLTAFRRDIIGQDAACETAADVVIQFKSSMNDPHRPLGVLLFSGPTGVGKTELAKAMSRYLFGADRKSATTRLIRLDMSEYASPWAADRLLLRADGEPSEFIQRIRRQPFSVVLFDEIEKAHPDIFDVLMNVFDEGRLTDRFGRATIFRSAVIVLTSNLGATSSSQLGFGERSDSGRYEAAAREFFRPEFFNRLDAVVRFHALPASAIEAITEKELREIALREGLKKLSLRLSWSHEVVAYLAQTGFDPRYGARPLQRAIERQVVTPLARLLLDGRVTTGTNVSLNLNSSGEIVLS
ncbi:MAG: ATP-dependent Clp protease ATP-binding subunit [Planctomycetaceae bacterium]|nr:ATP-dependent Clp protease ATP-binding subunit [Planctomycetaceae bacterium]